MYTPSASDVRCVFYLSKCLFRLVGCCHVELSQGGREGEKGGRKRRERERREGERERGREGEREGEREGGRRNERRKVNSRKGKKIKKGHHKTMYKMSYLTLSRWIPGHFISLLVPEVVMIPINGRSEHVIISRLYS